MLKRFVALMSRHPMRMCHKTIKRSSHVSTVGSIKEDTSQLDDPVYQNAKPFSEIPGPKGLPFFGTLLQYRRGPFTVNRFQDALLERYRQYGPIMKETIAGETVVHLFHPDYIKTVYSHEGKIPHIPPLLETTQMYRKYRNLSPGLGNTNGEQWYRLRSAVQQMMMRPQAVTAYLSGTGQVVDDFITQIKSILPSDGQIPNFQNEIKKWNLESSGMTCFETRFGCLEADKDSLQQKLINANADIFNLSRTLKFSIPMYKYITTPTWKKLVEAEDFFFSNGQKYVDETTKKIQELMDSQSLEEGKYAFLTYLLSKKELSYKDISIIALSLFGDGLSTTVPTTIGQIYCLARNPDIQEKAYEEVSSVVPLDQPITGKMLNQLSYLKACIKEGFRFFPIGTEVSRIPQKNLTVGGYQIPAGTHVELNNNMLLRLPEYFEEPEKYIPERWMRGGSGHNIHPYLLIPFGHGPRMCAGRRFAEQEMYVLISRLLQNFRIEWPHSDKMDQYYNMLLWPDKPAQFKFIRRNT